MLFGNRSQVWRGLAKKTAGGLTKGKLMKNKAGKIVSKKMHAHGMKMKPMLKKRRYKRGGIILK